MAPNMFKHLGLPHTWKYILGDDACYLTSNLDAPDATAWFLADQQPTFQKEVVWEEGVAPKLVGTWDLGEDNSEVGRGNMIDEQITVKKIDNHYHIQIGCQETIVHDKKEALKWLGKLWDEHIKEE